MSPIVTRCPLAQTCAASRVAMAHGSRCLTAARLGGCADVASDHRVPCSRRPGDDGTAVTRRSGHSAGICGRSRPAGITRGHARFGRTRRTDRAAVSDRSRRPRSCPLGCDQRRGVHGGGRRGGRWCAARSCRNPDGPAHLARACAAHRHTWFRSPLTMSSTAMDSTAMDSPTMTWGPTGPS